MDSCEPINNGVVIHRNVWLAEHSPAHALWCHDREVNDQNMVFLSIFQGQLAMLLEENFTSKPNVNAMKSIVNLKREV